MTKGELTARRKATECGRHTLLTKSGGWQKAATREFEATTKKSGIELHVEFAQVCKEYQRADAAHTSPL
jgi:hypothetical protein